MECNETLNVSGSGIKFCADFRDPTSHQRRSSRSDEFGSFDFAKINLVYKESQHRESTTAAGLLILFNWNVE